MSDHLPCKDCNSKCNSVFCDLTHDEIKKISDTKRCITYSKGQTIFTENTNPVGLFCVKHGKIKLTKNQENGRDQIFRFAKDGDLLGFRSFLSNQPYAVSAVTLEESTVCYIPKESFFDTIKKSENLTGSLFSKLNDDLNFAEERLSTISNKSLRERVAEALIIFEKTYGFLEDGNTINLQLSREEIAQFIGTATESLIRFLSEFDKDGIIELRGKKIKILDLKKLEKTANLLD